MKAKRSEVKAKLLNDLRIVGQGQWANELAERALAVFEKSAGAEWEPEEPEWPILTAEPGTPPGMAGVGVVLLGYHFDKNLSFALDGAVAARVIRAWAARRPGGEMERQLRDLESGLRQAGEAGWAALVLDALRLGVEP